METPASRAESKIDPIASGDPTPSRIDERPLEDLAVQIARGLIIEGSAQGNWEDARGTGDVLLALSEILPASAFPRLRQSAYEFLSAAAVEDGQSTSWGEEVWDTSFALLALCRNPNPDRVLIERGARWLLEIYERNGNNWYSEPWETLWALVAMHDAIGVVPELRNSFDPRPVLEWLLALLESRDGMLVNYHYTAQFLIAASRWLDHPVMLERDSHLSERVQAMRVAAAASLNRALDEKPDGALWTPELWANSLIIWGLADAGAIASRPAWFDRVTRELRTALSENPPTEDRALAVVALTRLARLAVQRTNERLPEGLLALESRIPDPTLRVLLEHVMQLELQQTGEAQRSRLVTRLTDLPDYRVHPPAFSSRVHRGYYTINIGTTATNVVLILTTTFTFTAISIYAGDWLDRRTAALLTSLPIGLGVLATLAQILDVRPREWFLKRNA